MEFKQTALKAVKEAGEYLKQKFNTNINTKTKNKGGYNIITKSDLKAEKIIKKIIKDEFPEHSIIAEESDIYKGKSNYKWFVDPIDGTNNFSQGVPHFAISAALYKSKQPIFGVIFDPIKDENFYAKAGSEKSFLNNEKIEVSDKSDLKESILVTGFSYEKSGVHSMKTVTDLKQFLSNDIGGVRRLGSAALDMCYVACGRFDGYWEYDLSPWDYAAGAIILKEAGGKTTSATGKDYSISQQEVIASNNKIHADILTTIQID